MKEIIYIASDHAGFDLKNQIPVEKNTDVFQSGVEGPTLSADGYEFQIWVPLNGNEVYSKSIQHNGRSAILWGLAHEEHNELLGN